MLSDRAKIVEKGRVLKSPGSLSHYDDHISWQPGCLAFEATMALGAKIVEFEPMLKIHPKRIVPKARISTSTWTLLN